MVPPTTVKKQASFILMVRFLYPPFRFSVTCGGWVRFTCGASWTRVVCLCCFSCGQLPSCFGKRLVHSLTCASNVTHCTKLCPNLSLAYILTLTRRSTSTPVVLHLLCPIVHGKGAPPFSILCLFCVRFSKSHSFLSDKLSNTDYLRVTYVILCVRALSDFSKNKPGVHSCCTRMFSKCVDCLRLLLFETCDINREENNLGYWLVFLA